MLNVLTLSLLGSWLPFLCASQKSTLSDEKIYQEINEVIRTMSLEEKVGQTCQITLDVLLETDSSGAVVEPVRIDKNKVNEALLTHHVGSVLNVGWHTLPLNVWTRIHEDVQAPFKSNKSKTPILYGIDAIHGVNYTVGGTLFPQEIGLAATWDTALAKRFGEITAYETRASGIHWNFSPVLDLGRQPLWSRHFETLGEDPLLASRMGNSIVYGYQGEGQIDEFHVAACLKHFVGYSNPKSGRDRTPAWIPEVHMKELYLPPFKSAIDAGALTVMVNSGVVNGVPGHINKHLLTDVLKNSWGFKGFAVSDWEDFIMLHTVHRTASSLKDAVIQGFNAGVDMSMVPLAPQYKEYCQYLVDAVKEGAVSEERLNDAVRRILYVKMRVGLFDKKMNQAKKYEAFGSEVHQASAKQAALASITLLKNDGALPLQQNQRILVAGPTSNDLIFLNGAWTHTWQGADTSFNTVGRTNIHEEFVRVFGTDQVVFSQGAKLDVKDGYENSSLLDTADFREKANQSDVIVLCLGEYPSTEKPGDIRSLNLDDAQQELASIAYETKKPVILVLVEGRPRIIRDIVPEAEAIVQCYLPGDFGAEALVELLMGKKNFSGELPYTYPKYDGQIEFYDHEFSVARGKSNGFDAFDPQWEFGHGLSYSEIVYSDMSLNRSEMLVTDQIKVDLWIENTSEMAKTEVVQLYISDKFASISPANKKLKDFQKIHLNPKEKKNVRFILNADDLKFVNAEGKWVVEPGEFDIEVGTLTQSFQLK